MVSLWPWRGDDTSPASFEKRLSLVSEKITNTTYSLDGKRQSSRRYKALWTLYTSFAYLLYAIILALVVGWKQWGVVEYAAIFTGPIAIYAVRLGLTTYYDYRASNLQAHLNDLQKQRDQTIDRLKTATKYNSTQQLLEKYSGTPSKVKAPSNKIQKTSPTRGVNASKGGRNSFVAPPTANIPRRSLPASLTNTPQRSAFEAGILPGDGPPFSAAAVAPPWQEPSPFQRGSAEFAPNAFSAPPQFAQEGERPRWYDRFMDVLLGEDETLPKNRLALICRQCRLVNGQAPPGIKHLEDVGQWKCYGCGTMNGDESEAKKLVHSIREQTASEEQEASKMAAAEVQTTNDAAEDDLDRAPSDDESDITQYSDISKSDGVTTDKKSEPKPIVRRSDRVRSKASSSKNQ